MSRIGKNGYWQKVGKRWQYIITSNDNSDEINDWLKSFSNLTSFDSRKQTAWKCILSYLKSSRDVQNLAATCRFMHELVDSELGWSYLIRTRFGYRLWSFYIRQIFSQENESSINLYNNIENMTVDEIIDQCTIIPTTFLLNGVKGQLLPVSRAILRSYRYFLKTEPRKTNVYMNVSKYIFRRLVSFMNIHGERLTDVQRTNTPLTKLIYFYLADQRHVTVVNFDMIYPRVTTKQILDSSASTGRALLLNSYDRMIVLHHYKSVMPGRYKIIWRLRFVSPPVLQDYLEFIAVPQYGLLARKHTSDKQFQMAFKKYNNSYFHQSMGILTVFRRCVVFVGCIDLTMNLSRTNLVLDYVEMIAID